MDSSVLRRRVTAAAVLLLLIAAAIFLKMIFAQNLRSVEELQAYMLRFGVCAPLVLTVIQALQVVVPVLPGLLGCAAGSVLFGPAVGFLCNYTGICLGSIAAYYLAKRYGTKIILMLFSEKQYKTWSERAARYRSYGAFLFVATLLPLFPDDFLCYFSGLICMDAKRFIRIILLGKPWCILAYCLLFGLL